LYRIICVFLLLSLITYPAQAALLVTAFQSGSNVVFSGSGTLNLGDMSFNDDNVVGSGVVQAGFGNFLLGDNSTTGENYTVSAGHLPSVQVLSIFSPTRTLAIFLALTHWRITCMCPMDL
jgi:hypothetical protein